MRIPLTCMRCNHAPDQQNFTLYPAELQDSGLYRLVCIKEHETFICLQEQKFEVLFELALNAIVDGYYREAVASFSSAIERFYEFYLRVVCAKRGLDNATVEAAWKAVSKQSERQFGAYVFTYLTEIGSVAPQLPDKKVTFRNDVIHKGKIPSRDEAITYGEEVLKVISPILDIVKKNDHEYVNSVVMNYIKNVHENISGTPHVSFMSISTTVSISRAFSEPQPSVLDSITSLIDFRKRSGW